MGDEILVTVGQAVALLRGKGIDVGHPGLRKVVVDLARDGRIRGRPQGEDVRLWLLSASELDAVEGELWRKRAGWWRRSNVSQGFSAWVDGGDGVARILLLPYERRLEGARELVVGDKAAVVLCYEWPTGRLTGRLVRGAETRDGLPVYAWEAI